MRYLADLHIHSPYSRGTSKNATLESLTAWARVKGIHVLGTGDFTHPAWFRILQETLVPAEPGLFRLKDEHIPAAMPGVDPEPIPVRFVLTAEISSIYSRGGKVRKVHNLLLVPDFQAAARINAKLAGIGNIESDGRPILGLDSRILLEILLEHAPEGFLVPAHIWTPWFSILGSRSGFDSIEECFGDLSEHVFALETGLSSDPKMNRLVSRLDRYTLISNSDAHSAAKLGREANRFDTALNFFAMRDALKNPTAGGFLGTLEFFPEEGKYHLDGHRKCAVCLEPEETRKLQGKCPVCGRPVTVGVSHRVFELADRDEALFPENDPGFKSLVPLPEVLGEILDQGPNTKGVLALYGRLISLFGSEFNLLLDASIDEINRRASPVLGEAIRRIRSNTVITIPGYDGDFGTIKVFEESERDRYAGQLQLFTSPHGLSTGQRRKTARPFAQKEKKEVEDHPLPEESFALNPDQQRAVLSTARAILVKAGPGTGKTATLVARLTRLLTEGQTSANRFVVITFTNRAAREVRERLAREIGPTSEAVFVGTFHAFCLSWLRQEQPDLMVIGNMEREIVLKNALPHLSRAERRQVADELADYFETLASHAPAADDFGPPANEALAAYLAALTKQQAIDLDAVIPTYNLLVATRTEVRAALLASTEHLFVDEFQDLNQSQYQLVRTLAEHARVFAIGDPDQAIYGFRGASPRFFYAFEEEFSAEPLALTHNYRSAPAILAAAEAVIRHNPGPKRPTLCPHRQGQTVLEHYIAPTPQAEAELVTRRIDELVGGLSHRSMDNKSPAEGLVADRSFKDIAILFRLNQLTPPLVEALERAGIPFQLVGATPFFMRKGIRAAYAWVQAAHNPGGASVLSLLPEIQGVGESSLRLLEQAVPLNTSDFFAKAFHLTLAPKMRETLQNVLSALDRFREKLATDSLASALAESYGFLGIAANDPDAARLLVLAGGFGRELAAFADHLEQNARAFIYDKRAEGVALMTLHAAKGLEFPVVFLVGLEDGILPCLLPGLETAPQEERRLFYVGLTRAKETLVLTSAATRSIFGKQGRQTLSPFLAEIPTHLVRSHEYGVPKKKVLQANQMRLF